MQMDWEAVGAVGELVGAVVDRTPVIRAIRNMGFPSILDERVRFVARLLEGEKMVRTKTGAALYGLPSGIHML
jgi:hypothetical protein